MWGCVRTPLRFVPVALCAAACLVLAQCSNSGRMDPYLGVSASPRVVDNGTPAPKGGGTYHVGHPYMVAGRVYVPRENPHYSAEGLASWYGDDFHGRLTANGEVFDASAITAAHPTLPLPCYVRVTDLSNGRSLIVRVNDRGPFHGNRIIDVSVHAARMLGFYDRGVAWVRIEYVGRAPLNGSDDRVLAATLRQDEPAPAPSLVASAAPAGTTGAIPVAMVSPPAPVPDTRLASAYAGDAADPPRAHALPAARTSLIGFDGTSQFLNGRGLY